MQLAAVDRCLGFWAFSVRNSVVPMLPVTHIEGPKAWQWKGQMCTSAAVRGDDELVLICCPDLRSDVLVAPYTPRFYILAGGWGGGVFLLL